MTRRFGDVSFAICGSLLVGIVAVVSGGVQAQDRSAESAIRAIVAAQADAWNAGDGAGYAKDVAADVSFTNLLGMAGIAVPADGVVRTQLMEAFVRRGGRWWIEAYHNVDTKPAS